MKSFIIAMVAFIGLVAIAHASPPMIGDDPVIFKSDKEGTIMVFPHAKHEFCISCHSIPEVKAPTQCNHCHLDKQMFKKYIDFFNERKARYEAAENAEKPKEQTH